MDLNETFEKSVLSEREWLCDYREWLFDRIKPYMEAGDLESIGAEILQFIEDKGLMTEGAVKEWEEITG